MALAKFASSPLLLFLLRTCFVAGSIDLQANLNEARALSARIDYQEIRGPELDGRLTLNQPTFALHLGGFCFGHTGDEDDREVAKLKASLAFETDEPWQATGSLYLAFYDARDDRWGKAMAQWETSSCADKLSLATYMDFSDILANQNAASTYTRLGTIMQHSGTRDWHATLIGCDVRFNTSAANPKIRYELIGTHGALSVFAADNLHPNSCPSTPRNWWTFAVVDQTFWIIVAGAIALYALLILLLVNYHRKQRSGVSRSKKMPDDIENVIGLPSDSTIKGKELDIAPLPVGQSCDSLDALQTAPDTNGKTEHPLRSE